MQLEFTKSDLTSVYKKMNDLMQELTDYSGNAEECKKTKLGESLDNAIAGISDAQGSIEEAMKLIH